MVTPFIFDYFHMGLKGGREFAVANLKCKQTPLEDFSLFKSFSENGNKVLVFSL